MQHTFSPNFADPFFIPFLLRSLQHYKLRQYFPPCAMKNPKDVLHAAAELVSGDRASQHGDMHDNHEHIAEIWNGYLFDKLHATLTPADAASMMELLKIARRKAGAFNRDDYIDAAGYAAVAYMCDSRK